MSYLTSFATDDLVKNTLAEKLRQEILAGNLKPGERIVEGKWASRFGVAQASIREAINILSQAGFVTKASGRSARVINLSEIDVARIYELRGAIEGLAARTAARESRSVSTLQAAMDSMRTSAKAGDLAGLIDGDLLFHLELCSLSGNSFLVEHGRRLLLPLFAFVRMRVSASGQSPSAWDKDLAAHQKIIDLISEGEADVAEHYVRRAMERFAQTAYDNWEKRDASGK